MNYEEAREEFSKLCNGRRSHVALRVILTPHDVLGEEQQSVYDVTAYAGPFSYSGTYMRGCLALIGDAEKQGRAIETEVGTRVDLAALRRFIGGRHWKTEPNLKALVKVHLQCPPREEDVLEALLRDSEPFIDSPSLTFKEWLDEFWSPDNKTHPAELYEMFSKCQQASGLMRLFFGPEMERARELSREM